MDSIGIKETKLGQLLAWPLDFWYGPTVYYFLLSLNLVKQPLLDLDLRLGEGTGAALAMPLVAASVRILTEVATFDEASVSKAEP